VVFCFVLGGAVVGVLRGVLWSWWWWILWWAGAFDLGSGRGRGWGFVRLGSRGCEEKNHIG
jgi:hypothetical protein